MSHRIQVPVQRVGGGRGIVRNVNAIVGIAGLITAAFAAVFGEADAFYFTAAVTFVCWCIDWALCRRPKDRERNALAAMAAFTVLLAYALGASCAPAHADPIGPNCDTVLWGFLGSQRRTVCDTPKNAAGEWTRTRTIWTPAHYVPFRCTYSSYSSTCWGGYQVDMAINDQDRYPVTDATVLPDEPGCLGIGGRTV